MKPEHPKPSTKGRPHQASGPQLVEHPVLGRIHALQVLDDTAGHVD